MLVVFFVTHNWNIIEEMKNLLNTNGKMEYTLGMSLFSKNNSKEAQKFLEEFSKKINDEALSVELANLIADKQNLDALSLTQWFGRDAGLWGLLVFCKKGLYFYVHESQSLMFSMIRPKEESNTIPEQLLSFANLENVHFEVKPKTVWNFLDGERKHTIVVTYKGKDSLQRLFSLHTQHDAASVITRIKEIETYSTTG